MSTETTVTVPTSRRRRTDSEWNRLVAIEKVTADIRADIFALLTQPDARWCVTLREGDGHLVGCGNQFATSGTELTELRGYAHQFARDHHAEYVGHAERLCQYCANEIAAVFDVDGAWCTTDHQTADRTSESTVRSLWRDDRLTAARRILADASGCAA